MILRALAIAAAATVFLGGCAGTEKWAYFPTTLPFSVPTLEPGAHLTEAQAIELAVSVAVYHRTNPANYSPPKASYKSGEWHVFFDARPGPPVPALGSHFSVYIYERNNRFSFSPGR